MGQNCCAISKLYIHQSIYAKALELIADEISRFKYGDPQSDESFIGPIGNQVLILFLIHNIQKF